MCPVPFPRPDYRSGTGSPVPGTAASGRPGRSAWHWLLAVPVIGPQLTPLYNRIEPSLFGLPFFYWSQLGFVFCSIAITTLVYQATKWRT